MKIDRASVNLLIRIYFLSIFCTFLYAKDFSTWKMNYAKRVSRRGLKSDFVQSILSKVRFNQEVINKDQNQVLLDKNLDYNSFIEKWLRDNPSRIEQGQKLLKKHARLLGKIESKYGVDREIIISLWGVETLYGQVKGDYNVIEALASLAYKGRRKKFFETQLNAALRLIRKGHISFYDFKGSWAGATGHCQFMPSNIPAFGQDFNKDGKIDLWHDLEDVFASIANYLKKSGWKKGKSIGSLASETKGKIRHLNRYRSHKQYRRLGIANLDGQNLKRGNWRQRRAARIPLKNSPIILRGSNYSPLLRWNNSSLFAAFNIILMEGLKANN